MEPFLTTTPSLFSFFLRSFFLSSEDKKLLRNLQHRTEKGLPCEYWHKLKVNPKMVGRIINLGSAQYKINENHSSCLLTNFKSTCLKVVTSACFTPFSSLQFNRPQCGNSQNFLRKFVRFSFLNFKVLLQSSYS
jgi:hypothetical protein